MNILKRSHIKLFGPVVVYSLVAGLIWIILNSNPDFVSFIAIGFLIDSTFNLIKKIENA